VADRVCLPEGATVEYSYGADKTLVVLGPEAEGADVAAYLAATLPELGWTVTGTGAGAIRFERDEWTGSFAVGDGEWGLTVRAE
jgi:hypothetical protein